MNLTLAYHHRSVSSCGWGYNISMHLAISCGCTMNDEWLTPPRARAFPFWMWIVMQRIPRECLLRGLFCLIYYHAPMSRKVAAKEEAERQIAATFQKEKKQGDYSALSEKLQTVHNSCSPWCVFDVPIYCPLMRRRAAIGAFFYDDLNCAPHNLSFATLVLFISYCFSY